MSCVLILSNKTNNTLGLDSCRLISNEEWNPWTTLTHLHLFKKRDPQRRTFLQHLWSRKQLTLCQRMNVTCLNNPKTNICIFIIYSTKTSVDVMFHCGKASIGLASKAYLKLPIVGVLHNCSAASELFEGFWPLFYTKFIHLQHNEGVLPCICLKSDNISLLGFKFDRPILHFEPYFGVVILGV